MALVDQGPLYFSARKANPITWNVIVNGNKTQPTKGIKESIDGSHPIFIGKNLNFFLACLMLYHYVLRSNL